MSEMRTFWTTPATTIDMSALTNEIAALRAQLTTAERERDEARRERDALAEWKRDTEEHARLFIGFGQSYENEPVFSIMGGANQNYSYFVGQCERLQEELATMRHRAERAERVVVAARAYKKTQYPHLQRELFQAVRALDAAEGTNA